MINLLNILTYEDLENIIDIFEIHPEELNSLYNKGSIKVYETPLHYPSTTNILIDSNEEVKKCLTEDFLYNTGGDLSYAQSGEYLIVDVVEEIEKYFITKEGLLLEFKL